MYECLLTVFVKTLTSEAIALDVMGMIQAIRNDAKTMQSEVIDAKDSNACVHADLRQESGWQDHHSGRGD